MKRKILAALIAVMMVVTMLPLSVMAAEPVTTEAALRSAVATGGTVVLGADIELTNTFLKVADEVTIDLNGHTISGNFESDYGTVYVGTSGRLYVEDYSEAGTGAITSTKSYAIGNYGDVSIYKMTYSSANGSFSGGEGYAALYNFYYNDSTYGYADIYGGTFDEIWNCGEVDVSDVEIGIFDNSGGLTLFGGTVIDTLIDRNGEDALGEGTSYINFDRTNIASPDVIKNAEDENGKSVDVYEKYKADKYAVRFEVDGGNGTVPTDLFVTPGKKYGTLPTVTKDGYTFDGWFIRVDTTAEDLKEPLPFALTLAEDDTADTSEPVYEYVRVDEDDIVKIEYGMLNYDSEAGETTSDPYIVLKAFWNEVVEEETKPEPKFDMPRLNLRSIVIDTTEGGKTNVASGRCYGALGSTHRLTLTPDEGYEIGEVLVNGKAVEANKNGKISFVVKGNTYVEVEFVEIED